MITAGGKEALSHTDAGGKTALHYSCHSNHLDNIAVVRMLAKAGATVNAVDNDGHTPLRHVASWGEATTIYQLVMYGAEIDLRGPSSSTPLMEACFHNGLVVVMAFLKEGADPNAQTDSMTLYYLHFSDIIWMRNRIISSTSY